MKTDDKLEQALRDARPMNDADLESQRRSFVYGNTKIEYDNLTRAVVDEVADFAARTPSSSG